MIMKQLFRQTATLLRTALLFGAVILVNTQIVKAQTAAQRAAMPDAFETKIPSDVVGDGNYYYIQFYFGTNISYLSDLGNGNKLWSKDYIPFAKNLQWTLVSTGTANQFKLKSLSGNWASFNGTDYISTNVESQASVFTSYSRSDGGYEIGLATDANHTMAGNSSDGPWVNIWNNSKGNARSCLRVVKLKDNVAHIIYWQETIYRNGDTSQPVDPNTDSRANANGFTTHHYLTYSGTGDVISDAVSSRKSVVWYYDAWNTLPTLAAYHQDGLWTLEPAGDNGEFFIKKYGTEEYLNYQNLISELGAKNADFGKYALENPNANRYTRIKNANRFALNDLTAAMFFQWDGYGADPSSTSNASSIAFNVGNSVTLNSGNVVAGRSDGNVPCLVYANLTGSKKMLIEGTPGVQLRVMLNRQDSDSGPWTEKTVTLNSSGKGEVDLSDLPYAHLNSIKMGWSSPSGTISSIKLQSLSSSGSDLYLSCNKTDGIEVSQVSGGNASYLYTTDWVAGFMPVEVPVPNKDEFYQVQVRLFSASGDLLNYTGNAEAYTEAKEKSYLWQLEQVDDYKHFRLKRKSTGEYLAGQNSMTQPNDPDGDPKAEVRTIDKYFGDFSVKWFYVNPTQKEFPVNYMVTHRESYLKQYAEQYASMELDKQGLATGAQSDWWNYEKQIQKVNHFEITHFVKEGNSMVVEFPTVLNKSNNHVYYQRFYNYDEDENSMDLDNLKAHVSLDTRDDGNVQYYLYQNGIVTGQKLNWDGKDDGGMARNALRRFNFTNSDGQPFTVAVDVSRYSDLTYKDATPETGDLEEPSLTMRYIYYMKDAKEMAKNLTACTEGSGKWLETKTFHFPMKQIFYEDQKKVGYRGEFIGLRHVFSDYWVFNDGDPNSTDNNNLVSAVIDNTQGRIEVVIVDNGTGIRKGGYNPNIDLKGMTEGVDADYQGFYFYDKMSDQNKTQYGDSRFVVFRYPSSGEVAQTGADHPAYVNVYLNNNGTRYQLAQFTIIFDPGTVTLPYTSVNGSTYVKDEVANTSTYTDGIETKYFKDRDPKKLVEKAGKPIAKITFDYPSGDMYHFPSSGVSIQGWERAAGSTVDGSSPVPLTFDKTNYSFSAFECNWGSYAMVTNMSTNYGNHKNVLPANDNDKGYGDASVQALQADPGLQKAFLYIDASEQPGDICSAPFIGDFCSGDKLLFSGWISSSNKMGGGDNRCPGGITLTVKGEHNVHNADGTIKYDEKGNPVKDTVTVYRFCPGQIYELDNGGGVDGSGDGSTHVVWQQFYFEFTVTDKYDRHWIEVNNNCVSSQGGDFMLDNIAVYAIVPEVKPGVNTPVCVDKNGKTEMRLLKLSVDFNKQISSAGVNSGEAELGFVFLEKDLFLKTFRTELQKLDETDKEQLHLEGFNFNTISLDVLADAIKDGEFKAITGEASGKGNIAYRTAFDAAIVGDKKTYYTKNEFTAADKNASIIYFQYNSDFSQMPAYSFASAVNKEYAVYGEEINGERYIVMNGNYPEMNWKANTDYYILISNRGITSGEPFSVFNLCSECNKASEFRIEPPYSILGLESSEDANSYVVCEGQIPTLLTDLKGYDLNGNEVPMKDLNYDWWIGDATTVATLENYHKQNNGAGVKLDKAIAALRTYYPGVTDLSGLMALGEDPNPQLTLPMLQYLQELVDKGQLILHQKSISVPAVPAGAEDPYFYLVACPIHDEQFKQALNPDSRSVIHNGSMEGADVSSFYWCDPSTSFAKIPATITTGAGNGNSRGISITTTDTGNSNPWDTQFFIRANEVIPEGKKIHVKFNYKASAAVTGVETQAHGIPGNYNHNQALGTLDFTTGWKTYDQVISVSSQMANGTDGSKPNSFQSIAFNLWKGNSGVTYYFDNVVLDVVEDSYVSFFCDEPQGLRVKVGQKAPTLKTGFVPQENGFAEYNYPTDSDPVLSIRLAKKAQFETVQHGESTETPVANPATAATDLHFLWLPIRNAVTQEGADHVIKKSDDYNIYLASTNDPIWDKNIYKSMAAGALPVVGKIVTLQAINTNSGSNLAAQNDENRLCVYFTENFEVREGYSYMLSLPFQEEGDVNTCDGTILINLKIVPDYEVWTCAAGNTDWNNDENWRRADGNTESTTYLNADELYVSAATTTSPLKDYKTNAWNYRTAKDRVFRKGFAPLYCTHVLLMTDEWGNAPVLYDALDRAGALAKSPFPNLRDQNGWDGQAGTKATATPVLRYDMQARLYDIWTETYADPPNKGRAGDLIAEMYQINSCDEIAFQPTTELLNAHLLNYNSAWVEYQLDTKRWYLLGSPLQGTVSGEWYAPTGNAKQETTYYDPVTFGLGYDRYSPAIYQRSWDKAKSVLYEVGSAYNKDDDKQDANLGNDDEGMWNNAGTTDAPVWQWQSDGTADQYLDRLGYKPMDDGKKANVAIKGLWSNTYNDAQVDYAQGGFSVMVMNHLKGNAADVKAVVRLPKEDTMYDYYKFDEDGSDDGGTDTELSTVRTDKNRAKNRGRLKTDLLLPPTAQKTEVTDSRYGDKRTYTRIPIKESDLQAMEGTFDQQGSSPATAGFFSETVAAGASNLGFYLVENPFPCGLDMNRFFAANTSLQPKYWLLTATGQHLVQKAATGEWITPSAEAPYSFAPAAGVLPPGQGFFVQATTAGEGTAITFNKDMQTPSRYGVESGSPRTFSVEVGQTQTMEQLKELVDNDNDPSTPDVEMPVFINVDTNRNGIYGEEGEQEPVMMPVWEKETNGDYKLDANGNRIPVLTPIMQNVTLYTYVQSSEAGKQFPLKGRTRGGDAGEASPLGLVITAERGEQQSCALVMQRDKASNDFLPEEDTEVFINSDLENVPTVYTLCGRLATSINSIHDFLSLPVGVESNSSSPCTLTFRGVETLGDSIAFYDALEQKLMPLESGMKVVVSGQTQNRYYIVRSLNQKEVAEETHLQIFTEGLTAKVIASTAEPITDVRCFDTAGRLIHSANPQTTEYSFSLPAKGIYIIEAQTDNDRKTVKLMAK